MSLNDDLAGLFETLAKLMELKGETVFKVIAFTKVARIIRESNFDLRECMQNNTLCDIEGIGKASQQIIEEYIQTGKSTVFEEVAASVPAGLVPLLTIEGLGPKTIHQIWQQAKVTSIDELEKALASGALKGIKGLGEKKIATIKAGVEAYKARLSDGTSDAPRRYGIAEAMAAAEPLLEHVRKLPGVLRAEIAGSLRRRKETAADVDLIAAVKRTGDGAAISDAFSKISGVIQILGRGESKTSVKVANGMQVDLRIVPEENFGAALLYFTGSKEHNVKIRGMALRKKLTLNEWGLYKLDEYEKATKETAKPPHAVPVASRTEADVYEKLGLPFIEPELREDRGEIDAARESRLPKLIARADIRGDLHTHTTASDGTASIEEMALAAKALGYEYLAITDHSKALAMARGLTVDRLMKHIEEIHRVSDRIKGITLLAGSEVDILVDGRMDYDDDVLRELDIVIASPHVSLKQDTERATTRLLRAIDNKYVNFVAHPTGRLINGRAGLPLDFDRVFEAAAQSGTALEINSGYPRLDLNDVNARNALAAGCTLTINTDSHTPVFEEINWGIMVARRAWVEPRNVLNCMKLPELKKFLAAKRDRAS
jgi:DNA polymerase (family 10)